MAVLKKALITLTVAGPPGGKSTSLTNSVIQRVSHTNLINCLTTLQLVQPTVIAEREVISIFLLSRAGLSDQPSRIKSCISNDVT